MLNSRNTNSKNFKKPLYLHDQLYWKDFLNDTITYLSKLTDKNCIPLLLHRKKTFVLGLIIAAKSTEKLSTDLLTLPEKPFKYVLTYKYSQDHLELLFACIRAKNGYNNNPDVVQLKSSFKRILLQNSIVGSNHANCLMFEPYSNGSIFSLNWSKRSCSVDNFDQDNIDLEVSLYCDELQMTNYKEAILGYISDFIVRKLINKISCNICAQSLTDILLYEHAYVKSYSSLNNVKNRGGLFLPSRDVISVVESCEKIFNFISGKDFKKPKITSDRSIKQKMIHCVNKLIMIKKVFKGLDSHDIEYWTVNEDLHSSQLVKKISEYYFKIRMFRYAQDYTTKVLRKSSIGLRQQTNKLLLFKGL